MSNNGIRSCCKFIEEFVGTQVPQHSNGGALATQAEDHEYEEQLLVECRAMHLPIESILPELKAALRSNGNVVLSAEPGAGKTTRVPIALLEESWLDGKKILMLEPRRLAAQRAASYMAEQRGEKVGNTVGYRIRGEARTGRTTRIEIVTEGILTRMVQSDPAIPDVGLIIFDEFHERSIHADLGLALTLDVQAHLRSDLRILIMSATLNGVALSELLGAVPVIRSEGRTFPVGTHYLQHEPADSSFTQIEKTVIATILRALRDQSGDILVFLPGRREIRRLEELLSQRELPDDVSVNILHGDASPETQRAALAPPLPGTRKVILSTSISETSLTIDGVRVVIDSGLARSPRFDPRRGMSGLVTLPVSQAAAEQRRGRAGRQQPGVCYRLWTERQHAQLPQFAQPEISVAELAPLALELACWGTPDGKNLRFLNPPPPAHLAQARELLTRLGALDEKGNVTKHGKAMEQLGVHPRLAHMLLRANELGLGSLACDVAALLEENDLLRGDHDGDVDLHSRWFLLHHGGGRNGHAAERVRAQALRLRKQLDVREEKPSAERLGVVLALAYPERVAKRRGDDGLRFQLANGTGALLPKGSHLAREEYLAVADVDGVGSEVRIFLAAALRAKDILDAFGEQIQSMEDVRWDEKSASVVARRLKTLGELDLSESKITPSPEVVRTCVLAAIRSMGLDVLPWTKEATLVRARSEWLRSVHLVDDTWPDLSDHHLLHTLDQWLGPSLDGISARSHFPRLDMNRILRGMFSYRQLSELDRLAPTHLTVPTGSRIPVHYEAGTQPILAVRLQEMFGESETPTVGGGKVKVLLHLLSPAHRPLAVTQDLPSFWRNAYVDVRKDMRGRYPKHHWPENPLEAEPTRRTKKRKSS